MENSDKNIVFKDEECNSTGINKKRHEILKSNYITPTVTNHGCQNIYKSDCSDMASCSDIIADCVTAADRLGPCDFFFGCNGECCWYFLGSD